MKITRKRNVINKAGIFAGSLFVAASAVYLYSPVIGSHADTAVVGAEVNAMIALTTPESLHLEITPNAAGATASDSVTATVNTNSAYGYELYFSATDTNTDMTSTSSTATITSDFTATSLANIPVNSWGYSLDDTDYSPIPTSENSTRIRSIEHLPAGNELTTSIRFGTKVDSTLASGFYSDDVVFSAVAIAPPAPLLTMQGFDDSILPNNGDSIRLVDSRDGTIYGVARLADGRVWMTENLRIADKTITSNDSNIPAGETFTIPASEISAFTVGNDSGAVYVGDENRAFYNFYTATAGWGTYDRGEEEISPKDICPKGWRLPRSSDHLGIDELMNLASKYRYGEIITGQPGINGYWSVYNGVLDLESGEYFWFSRSMDNENGSVFSVDNEGYYEGAMGTSKNGSGVSVRCTLNEPTMQTFDKTKWLHEEGDSMQLNDERDGSLYTVVRLEDGNVWMIEDLKIMNKTLTSEDSNLPSGETFTIPASNISAFTNEYNTRAAYLNPTYPYGGFYNFYTATAGWGTYSRKEAESSPKDICPKGWRLPIHNSSTDEFEGLRDVYSNDFMMGSQEYDYSSGPNLYASGEIYNGQLSNAGHAGVYWTNSSYGDDDADGNGSGGALWIDSTGYSEGVIGNMKYDGAAIRCVAK